MSSQVVLILGAGTRVGKSLAQKFAGKGFKVAVASRSINPEIAKAVHASTEVDFSTTSSVRNVFTWATSEIGIPNVVVYNGWFSHVLLKCARIVADCPLSAFGNTMGLPFSVPLSQFETDLAVNTSSVYATIQEALAGFENLPTGTPKTFIFTGNRLNIEPMPALVSMGAGKTAAAHLVQAASMAFKDKGYR